jgi:peptide/nickel transport system ATP-binding protein/oligopeptide transport system ATP-binding protein
MMNEKDNGTLLKIRDLKTYFFMEEGIVRAVDGVTLTIRDRESRGVVGESGCGKSVTALSIMRLIQQPPGEIVSGEILLTGRGDLAKLPIREMQKIRGNEISMIFQEPMTSLNPVFRIGDQIAEGIQVHQKVSGKEAWNRSVEMLKLVGIPSAEKRAKDYPHQLSGGMRQRAMIAMALSCSPKLMIADEPTTALDVTIQAQILDLMNKMKEEVGTSILLITHDLGVIAEMAQTVSVMYAGVVVESSDVRTLFADPLHPYTKGLLRSIPRMGGNERKKTRLDTIPGIVPSLLDLPVGCRFSDRCSEVHEPCRKWEPPLTSPSKLLGKYHEVRCWLHITPPKR